MGIITNLNKAFENRIRLGIMSILISNERVDFNRFKELLDVTDGNLSSHLGALERNDFLTITKRFIAKKPNTTYYITSEGRNEFRLHLKNLESIIKGRI